MSITITSRDVASDPPRGLVILGHPVAHSLSPVFQAAALAHAGLAVAYHRRDVPPAQLDAALDALRAQGVAGNVTLPHKEAVASRAGRLTPRAHRTGAVNTFWWDRGTLVGHNTDVDGVRATLAALAPAGLHGPVAILGSGGSAAAVLVALAELGVTDVHLLARTPARAVALASRVGVKAAVHAFDVDAELDDKRPRADSAALLAAAALVVNTTPVGMQDHREPVPIGWLGAHTRVFDLVYRREGTAWVAAARARGLTAEDGLRMLVEQGAAAFETWFDRPASRAVMWSALGVPMPAPDRARA
jgi:shikimate dehydrogenase